ncbi:hypothetical protein NDU88_004365 [Pleurodeles waltl]|uniref:Uncharacterized protein n=1 Tax=Pleurodeles waltl TaxID=8319 RepID=A0AAV7WVL5_PLEWA|nr:hypothetical protein NDU88_004365 [Pleurodeles waltl]
MLSSKPLGTHPAPQGIDPVAQPQPHDSHPTPSKHLQSCVNRGSRAPLDEMLPGQKSQQEAPQVATRNIEILPRRRKER